MKTIIICLSLIFFATASIAEDERHYEDQKGAREAVERGDVKEYTELKRTINNQFKGRIIRVELDKRWRRWFYELRLLEDDGRVIEIEVDANNLQILEIEGRQLENVVITP